MTKKFALEELKKAIEEFLEKYNCKETNVLIVGSYNDLQKEREISFSEAHDFVFELGCPYMEASAKTGFNVSEIFETMTKMILEQ